MKLRRRLVLALFATLIAHPLAAADAKQATAPTPRPKIGSTVFVWEDLKVRPTPNGERRDVANHPTDTLSVFECHITTLNPGKSSHAPHRHPQEELIIVKEGTLEVHIDGQTQRAGPGSVFFYASNNAHAVTNVGDASVGRLRLGETQGPADQDGRETRRAQRLDGHDGKSHLPHHYGEPAHGIARRPSASRRRTRDRQGGHAGDHDQ
jgi:uncharacterized cupin superfamily protein